MQQFTQENNTSLNRRTKKKKKCISGLTLTLLRGTNTGGLHETATEGCYMAIDFFSGGGCTYRVVLLHTAVRLKLASTHIPTTNTLR